MRAKVSKYDMLRIDVVVNGYVISGRKVGKTPASYAYDDRRVAKTIGEAVANIQDMLEGGDYDS